MPPLLYLDQNYLSGIVKRKVAFRELEPARRAAVARGVIAVPESEAHRLESAARPDLPLLELLHELSAGLMLPNERDALARYCQRRLEAILERDFPERRSRASDRLDARALAAALPRCRLVTCDAFMADVVRRTGLDSASAASSSPAAARTSSGFAGVSSVSASASQQLIVRRSATDASLDAVPDPPFARSNNASRPGRWRHESRAEAWHSRVRSPAA